MADEQWIPGNRDELLAAIEREWNSLMQILGKLTEAQMLMPDEGGWSPKDNLAHLSEWMRALLGYHLDGRPAHEVLGLEPSQTEAWDFQVINASLFEKNRGRSMEDVMGDLKQTYAQVVKRIEETPFEDFLKPRHADDPEKRPLLLWILGDTSEHFAEHRETIEKMLLT